MNALVQYKTLAKVKSLREQKALEALQKARRDELDGERKVQRLTEELAESARTLPDRIHALFQEIIGTPVSLDEIDAVKARAAQLDADHQKIADRKARAEHTLLTLRERTRAALAAYKAAQIDREKYDDLIRDLKTELMAAATAAEEVEVEDLFSRPRMMSGRKEATQ